MSKNERIRKFDPAQVDKMFHELSTHLRGIKGILNAILDMPSFQKRDLQEPIDMLILANDVLAQVIETYDSQQELDFTHLLLAYKKQTNLSSLMVDLLACASDSSNEEAWKKKAIALCDRIINTIYPDDRPVILRAWVDLIGARGLKVCLINQNGERKPILEDRPEAAEKSALANCG